MAIKRGKIVLIGAGHVGSAILNALLGMNLANEIVLINLDRAQALGEAMDAGHTLAFPYCAGCDVRVGDYPDCAGAQIIINTAGPSIKPGEDDRMTLLRTNLAVTASVMEGITRYTRDALLIHVTNPVDVLTYVSVTRYDYPRCFSTGTLLDTARLHKLLGDRLGIDPKSLTGFVLGEHGETAFIPWSTVNVAGLPIDEMAAQVGAPLDREGILAAVKASGPDIIELKGYTSAGIALAACRAVSAIVYNTHAVLPLCVPANGAYGQQDVALSLPCVLAEKGVARVLRLPLREEEERALQQSGDALRAAIGSICAR